MNLEDLSARTIPSQLKFSEITPLGMSCRSKKVKFFPQSGGIFTPNNNIVRINVSSSTQFLDPQFTVLRFQYKNTSNKTMVFDNSAHAVIQQLRTISTSGHELENIDKYARLYTSLADALLDTSARLTLAGQGYGYHGILRTAQVVANPVVAVANDGVSEKTLGTSELTLTTGASATFFLPLLSSVIGYSQKKYLPLFLCGQITLELAFASAYRPYTIEANPTGTYEISNVELHTQLIEFDSSVNESLTAMTRKNGLFLHGTSWSSHFNPFVNGTGTIVISERLKSLKSILTSFSLPSADVTKRSMARHHGSVTGLQFKIGSEHYPNQPIVGVASSSTDNSEYIYELQKALGVYNNINHSSMINTVNFASDDDTPALCARPLFGIDLDGFSGNQIESGVNTILNTPINVNITCSASTPGLVNYTHLLYDVIYNITPDGQFLMSK